MSKRILADWLEAFLFAFERKESPTIFKKWTAISVIAAALQRKVYFEWEKRVFPNFYIVLVGSPATRKNTIIEPGESLLRTLGITLTADKITCEALIIELKEALAIIPGEFETFQEHASVTAICKELSIFLRHDDMTFTSALTAWFDSPDVWKYKTKNQGSDELSYVFFNLLGATTPQLIKNSFSMDTVGGGLTSRFIFVYGKEKSCLDPLPMIGDQRNELKKDLLHDLGIINTLVGEFKPTQQYLETYLDWYVEQSKSPALKDPIFEYYNERRSVHIRKLSMIVSASRSSSLILNESDFLDAKALLEECELDMPKVFGSYGRGEYAEILPSVMAVIQRSGEIRYNDLFAMFYRDLKEPELKEILLALVSMGWIDMEDKKEGLRSVPIIRKAKDYGRAKTSDSSLPQEPGIPPLQM